MGGMNKPHATPRPHPCPGKGKGSGEAPRFCGNQPRRPTSDGARSTPWPPVLSPPTNTTVATTTWTVPEFPPFFPRLAVGSPTYRPPIPPADYLHGKANCDPQSDPRGRQKNLWGKNELIAGDVPLGWFTNSSSQRHYQLPLFTEVN